MTPLQIKMMLHYYAIAAPYSKEDEDHANSPAVTEQREWLLNADMLRYSSKSSSESSSGYEVTERGEAFVDALCSLPLPVSKWVIP